MSDRQTLARAERLRTLSVIRRLFSEGESRFVYPFRVVWLPDDSTGNRNNPEISGASEVPGTPEVSKAAEVPGSSEASEVPGSTEASGITDRPEAPEASGITGLPEALQSSGTAAAVTAPVTAPVAAPATIAQAAGPAGPQLRVLFSVPKKFHKRANRRNLIRRRTKEAYRLHKSALHLLQPYNTALIYTSREVENYDRIAHAVRKIIALLNNLDR